MKHIMKKIAFKRSILVIIFLVIAGVLFSVRTLLSWQTNVPGVDWTEKNVGIGLQNPSSKLTIFNDGKSQPLDYILNIVQYSNRGIETDSNALLQFQHHNGSNYRSWRIGTGSNTLFGTADNFGIYDATASTTALVINNIGNIGVGTKNPQSKLHLHNNGGSNPAAYVLNISQYSNRGIETDSNALLQFQHHNGSNYRSWRIGTGSNTLFGTADNFGIYDATASTTALVINNIGNIGIGTKNPQSKLDIAGTITAQNYACSSDTRYKQDIAPISNALSKVLLLQGVNYKWNSALYKDKNFSKGMQIGFLAQDVEKVFPELVFTDKAGYKSMSYDKLTAVLVEAIKELKAENDSLKKKVASFDNLNKRIANLEKFFTGKIVANN